MRYVLWIISVICFYSSCENSVPTVVKGKLAENAGEIIYLQRQAENCGTKLIPDSARAILVNTDGTFSESFVLDSSGFFNLYGQNGRGAFAFGFFLRPGDTLFVEKTSDSNRSETGYSGTLANEHQVFVKLSAAESESYQQFPYRQRMSLPAARFDSLIKSLYQESREIVEVVFRDIASRSEIESFCMTYLKYTMANQYMSYVESMIRNEGGLFADSVIIKSLKNFACSQNEKYYFIPQYKYFIKNYADYKLYEQNFALPDSIRWRNGFSRFYKLIEREYVGAAHDIAIAALTYDFPQFMLEEDFYTTLNDFKRYASISIRNSHIRRSVLYDITQITSLKPDAIAPDFTLPGPGGELISLSDYDDKMIFLDFWGTWCYPCLQGIPKIIDLQEKYKDKDIVFIFIALEYGDEDIARWREFLAGKEFLKNEKFLNGKRFPGIHLVAERQFLNLMIAPYSIHFAPTYMLLGKGRRILIPRALSIEKISEMIETKTGKEQDIAI